MSAKHTATPWRLGKYGDVLQADGKNVLIEGFSLSGRATEETRATKEFIVRACNAHADLVMALQDAIKTIEALSGKDNSCDPAIECNEFRALIAKATGAA